MKILPLFFQELFLLLPSFRSLQHPAHTIFYVIVYDKVKFFFGKAVMFGKDFVGFVNDGF
jgi:hypothetical protein